jgi:hypothetical protein
MVRTDRCGAVDVIVSPSAALPDGRTGTDPGSAWSPIAASLKVLLPTTPEPIAASGSACFRSLPWTRHRVARALHREVRRPVSGGPTSGVATGASDCPQTGKTPRIRWIRGARARGLGAARSRLARSHLGCGRRRFRRRCRGGRGLDGGRRCDSGARGAGRRIAGHDGATERGRESQREQNSLDHDWGILRCEGRRRVRSLAWPGERPRRRTIDIADQRSPDFRGPKPCSGLSSRARTRARVLLGPGRR